MSGQEPSGLSKLNRTKSQGVTGDPTDENHPVPDAANGILDQGDYVMGSPINQPGQDYAWKNTKKRLLADLDRAKKERKARLRDAQLL